MRRTTPASSTSSTSNRTPAPAPFGMLGQRDLTGRQQTGALARSQGNGGGLQIRACFHLDERQQPIPLCHYVDLAGCRAQTLGQHDPAITLKRQARGCFGQNATRLRGPAAIYPNRHPRR